MTREDVSRHKMMRRRQVMRQPCVATQQLGPLLRPRGDRSWEMLQLRRELSEEDALFQVWRAAPTAVAGTWPAGSDAPDFANGGLAVGERRG